MSAAQFTAQNFRARRRAAHVDGAGDQFLAAAALPFDQHWIRRKSGAPDRVAHALGGRPRPEQIVGKDCVVHPTPGAAAT